MRNLCRTLHLTMEHSSDHATSSTATAQDRIAGTTSRPHRTRGKDKEERKRIAKVGWTIAEDELLSRGVTQHGSSGASWAKIAEAFEGTRCSKQCRERWTEYINPAYNRGHFTVEEDQLLLEIQPLYGNQWKEISYQLASKFQLRSSTRIKSRWTQLQRRKDAKKRPKPRDTNKETKSKVPNDVGPVIGQNAPAKRVRSEEISDVEDAGSSRVYTDMPSYARTPSHSVHTPTECSEYANSDEVDARDDDKMTCSLPLQPQYCIPAYLFHHPMQTPIIPSFHHPQWMLYHLPPSSSDIDSSEYPSYIPQFPFPPHSG